MVHLLQQPDIDFDRHEAASGSSKRALSPELKGRSRPTHLGTIPSYELAKVVGDVQLGVIIFPHDDDLIAGVDGPQPIFRAGIHKKNSVPFDPHILTGLGDAANDGNP